MPATPIFPQRAKLAIGLAHLAGGVKYVILATVAGWGYGSVVQRIRSIEAAIVTHFLVNLTHFILFTDPALTTAVT